MTLWSCNRERERAQSGHRGHRELSFATIPLTRIERADDPGVLFGTYGTRGDASKAVAKMAYEPEPRW
jgi:hypothetical protein